MKVKLVQIRLPMPQTCSGGDTCIGVSPPLWPADRFFFSFSPKVAHFKDFIPQAFPGGQSMILDSEVLLIDNKTGKPLPFGTLGVHKVKKKRKKNPLLWLRLFLR